MSYRDDRDADRARIDALEQELAAARRKLEAPGQPPLQLARQPETHATFTRYRRIYEIDAALSPKRVREALDTIATIEGEVTEVAVDGTRYITWSSQQRTIKVVVRGDCSTLTCTQKHDSIWVLFLGVAITLGLLLDAMSIMSLLWRGLAVALATAVMAIVDRRSRSREREGARQQFDQIAALLGVEVPQALPPGPAIAAGDEDAR